MSTKRASEFHSSRPSETGCVRLCADVLVQLGVVSFLFRLVPNKEEEEEGGRQLAGAQVAASLSFASARILWLRAISSRGSCECARG